MALNPSMIFVNSFCIVVVFAFVFVNLFFEVMSFRVMSEHKQHF